LRSGEGAGGPAGTRRKKRGTLSVFEKERKKTRGETVTFAKKKSVKKRKEHLGLPIASSFWERAAALENFSGQKKGIRKKTGHGGERKKSGRKAEQAR